MWDLKYDTSKLMKQKDSQKQEKNLWLSNGKGGREDEN